MSLYGLMESGQLPYVRVGARRLIRRDDLEDYIRRNTVGTRPESGLLDCPDDQVSSA